MNISKRNSSDAEDNELFIDDPSQIKRQRRDSSEEELNSNASSESSSDSRKQRRLAREARELADLSAASSKIENDIWLPDRLPEEHSFIKNERDHHLLLMVTGSVAAIKLQILIEMLYALHEEAYLGKSTVPNLKIRVILSECACHFVEESTVNSLYQLRKIFSYRDQHEYGVWSKRGDPVLHVELAKWADAILIAPMSANTMGKAAAGLCDNLLTCVLRAARPSMRVFYAPAMNTNMYRNGMTHRQNEALSSLGYVELPCIEKTLMCGDTGLGAMMEPQDIAKIVIKHLVDYCTKRAI